MVPVGLLSVICLMDPKGCFGSCPTFYVDGGSQDRPVAEGFSSSIARILEATDIDDLRMERDAGAAVGLVMRNEAWETHFVRRVGLQAVPVAPGERIVRDANGGFRPVTAIREATACGAQGGDCRAAVRAEDALEWHDTTSATDLAAPDTLVVTLPSVAGPSALLLEARQSFVSTYVLYQTMAYLGTEAGAWLARLERGDPAVLSALMRTNRLIGEIAIEIEEADGRWVPLARHAEAGPIASDVSLIALPATSDGRDLRVRLIHARGNWRFGLVARGAVGPPRAAVPLDAESITRVSGNLADPAPALRDPTRVLETSPGDAVRFVFRLPSDAARYAVFLESRGWYYEWLRESWMAEEDAEVAALILRDPAAALRLMAPGFKSREASMERDFWASRFGVR